MLHSRLHLQNRLTTTTAAQPDLPQPPLPPGTNVQQQQYRVAINRVAAPILTRGHFDRRFRCDSSALPSGACAFQRATHSFSEGSLRTSSSGGLRTTPSHRDPCFSPSPVSRVSNGPPVAYSPPPPPPNCQSPVRPLSIQTPSRIVPKR